MTEGFGPRSRRVPYVLDKSHLELVEDVLKETTFNLTDWYELGRELMKGPYVERIDYIKRASGYGNNSLKLKECLKSWLSSEITGTSFLLIYDEPHPTLDELADALRSIGYNEAAEYISKTYISAACHILWSNRGRLARIAIPDSSVQLLYRKELIRHESSMLSLKSMPMSSLTNMGSISSVGRSLSADELRDIYVAVDGDHNKLKDFAEILLLSKSNSTVFVATELFKEYYKLYTETVSTTSDTTPSVMRINVSETYREEFEVFINEYQKFCDRMIELVVDTVTIDEIYTYCIRNHPDVIMRLTDAVSSSDMMRGIANNCSITNIAPLGNVVQVYYITEGKPMIKDYLNLLDEFLSTLRSRYLLGSFKDIFNAETIIFDLDWTPDRSSLINIKQLFYKGLDCLKKKITVEANESSSGTCSRLSLKDQLVYSHQPQHEELQRQRKEAQEEKGEAKALINFNSEEILKENAEGEKLLTSEKLHVLQERIAKLEEKLQKERKEKELLIKSNETLKVKAEQRKALLLENEKLKSSHQNKTKTQQNEMIKNEVQHTMKELVESDIDNTQDSELLSTSMESMELKYSDYINTQYDTEENETRTTIKTSSKEVQFNYLVPSEDNLDGLSDSHIAGKKLFLVQGDKPQLMDWEEYGLRISVPEGCLSSSQTAEIAVIALVGGHFKFPMNTRLVSAVYAISASHFLKSLKLEVQHCIDLSDPLLCKHLKFAVAPVHTSSLPYEFSIVEGGEFPANSRYGSIERSKFCLLGIVGEEENRGQDNGEQSNGEQEQSNGEQQEQSNGEQEQSNGEQEQSNGEQEQSNGELQEQSNGEQEQSNGEQMSNRQERGDSKNESVCGKVNGKKEHLHKGGKQQQQGDRQKPVAGYVFQTVLQNINAPAYLKDCCKNEVEDEEMSEDDRTDSSIYEDKTSFDYPLEVEECNELELSQQGTSMNQMNKRPCEDECDDAALLPSVKKPRTDLDLLGLNGQSNKQEKENESVTGKRQTGLGKHQHHEGQVGQQVTEFGTKLIYTHSTGIPEATVYAGQVFYEQKDLMRFTAAKDLNALCMYIKKEYCHSTIDQGITFKLDPSLGYVELIFDGPQVKPTTGWSVQPHVEPCRIDEYEIVGFDGISSTHPPSCLVSIDVEDSPTTVRMLRYSVPLKGALNPNDAKPKNIVIVRSLKNILSGSTAIVLAAVSSQSRDPNIEKCAQDVLRRHCSDLKDLLSRSEATFRGIAGACRELKIINSFEYDEIFDGMTRQTLAERVDQFIEGIISMLKYCPDQLDVLLSMLKEKGNIALIRLAERIAQSFNNEVPDQYRIMLSES